MKTTLIDLADLQFLHLTCKSCKGGISYPFSAKAELIAECPHCSARWPNNDSSFALLRGWKLMQANTESPSVDVQLAISLE